MIRWPQGRLDRRLEEFAEAVGGGSCRIQMLLKLATGDKQTVAGASLFRTTILGFVKPPPPPLGSWPGAAPVGVLQWGWGGVGGQGNIRKGGGGRDPRISVPRMNQISPMVNFGLSHDGSFGLGRGIQEGGGGYTPLLLQCKAILIPPWGWGGGFGTRPWGWDGAGRGCSGSGRRRRTSSLRTKCLDQCSFSGGSRTLAVDAWLVPTERHLLPENRYG